MFARLASHPVLVTPLNLDSAVARGTLNESFAPEGVTTKPRCTLRVHLRFVVTLCDQSIRTLYPRSTAESRLNDEDLLSLVVDVTRKVKADVRTMRGESLIVQGFLKCRHLT